MVTAINHEGKLCPYRSLVCQEGFCGECQIYQEAIKMANRKLGLCPVCGTDRATVLGMLKDTGNKDNQDTALGILYNCPTCRNYFNGGKR